MALREFRKIYYQPEEWFAGAYCDARPLHHRQFIAACNDHEVPDHGRAHLLPLSLRGSAVHFFMETFDGLTRENATWKATRKAVPARFASLTTDQESFAVLDRLRITAFRVDNSDECTALTTRVNIIECTAPCHPPSQPR